MIKPLNLKLKYTPYIIHSETCDIPNLSVMTLHKSNLGISIKALDNRCTIGMNDWYKRRIKHLGQLKHWFTLWSAKINTLLKSLRQRNYHNTALHTTTLLHSSYILHATASLQHKLTAKYVFFGGLQRCNIFKVSQSAQPPPPHPPAKQHRQSAEMSSRIQQKSVIIKPDSLFVS